MSQSFRAGNAYSGEAASKKRVNASAFAKAAFFFNYLKCYFAGRFDLGKQARAREQPQSTNMACIVANRQLVLPADGEPDFQKC